MRIGYARVSTDGQNLDLQTSALSAAGCDRIFDDHASGAARSRPGLKAALRHLKPGDTLVVWRFDRLARSVPHLAALITSLQKRSVGFISLTEAVDTTTDIGLMIVYVLGAIAQFERALIRERVNAGLAAARARGSILGRKPALDQDQKRRVRRLCEVERLPISTVAAEFNVHPRTIRRCLATLPTAADTI
ncbi:recombinase family protein [Rhizobium sp. Rhizsp82]|uniref:recombinase family protein n=1 Tax=Rhizobium sp. Rhizsp82 TaxID=3243057 RepID=UPI0039B3F9D6